MILFYIYANILFLSEYIERHMPHSKERCPNILHQKKKLNLYKILQI